jgi:hypothetical protein
MWAGIALVIAGIAMVLVGRERADGSSIAARNAFTFAVYPAACLALLASGVALIIAGL